MNPFTQNDALPEGTDATEDISFPKFWRAVAMVVSIVLHPLFIPLIGAWIIVQTHFYQFAGFQGKQLIQYYGSVIANTLVLPAFTVFFLKKLHFISSIHMHSRRDRVIPYIATMTFYFWTYLVFRHQDMMPEVIKVFLLGNFIAVILAFLSNLKMKISMHTLGMGGLIGMLFCFLENPYIQIATPLMIVILAAGLVATCRLVLQAHTYREIYMGAAFGIFAQLLASWII